MSANCNLLYPVTDADIDSVNAMVGRLRTGEPIADVLKPPGALNIGPSLSAASGSRSMMMVYSDLEPDDMMCIAQLWQWKREREELCTVPLLIWHVDFLWKETGTIFEKKQLLSRMMFIDAKFHILIKEEDKPPEELKGGSHWHPRYAELFNGRDDTVKQIATQLANFQGDTIDFVVIAPGAGNIGAIVKELKRMGSWPLKAVWKVTMYTGSFNTRGMTDSDLEALKDIVDASKVPLVDMSRFPFFGGSGSHPSTSSLTTFVCPEFAGNLTKSYPLLGAALKSFNDEFNASLIMPKNESLFRGSSLTDDEKNRFSQIAEAWGTAGDSPQADYHDIRRYAKLLLDDKELYAKVANYKKGTVRSFALGACDSPLCDQLVFLHQWFLEQMPNSLSGYEPGTWVLNKEKGFSRISTSGEGAFSAIQPVMKEPKDTELLQMMKDNLQRYLLNFLAANSDRQIIGTSLLRTPLEDKSARFLSNAQFVRFWEAVDSEGKTNPNQMTSLAAKVASGKDGSIDVLMFMSWLCV